jgi:NitT/TauT family transport system ATP-binding protein
MDAIVREGPLPAISESARSLIEFRDLTVRFGADTGSPLLATSAVSFAVASGEFVSIVGPSGCGKSTILNAAAGLLVDGVAGHINVLGNRPVAGNPEIAYMLARDSLLPWRTALGNAIYGMELRKVEENERKGRAASMLRKVGLGDFLDAYPKALSHGMRQRCALARTFSLDSRIVLMDEPFGALDALTKIQLEDLLLSLWAQERKTILFVTHDLAEAVALSDRVIVLSSRPGKIVADVAIDLPRPRSARSQQQNPRFHELCANLWGLLELGH